MSYILPALKSFFQTTVGSYWAYMYIGIGILLCFLACYDNLRK